MFRILFSLALTLLPLGALGQTTIYLTPTEALKIIFKDSQEVISEKKSLTPVQQTSVEKTLGSKLLKSDWNFYVARTAGKIDGYALIDNEIGKTEPITFMTAILPDGSIKAVEILVYRESHGSEVHEESFRKQFKAKQTDDPIRVGQDIKNITGATLSSRAVALGVKRALLLWDQFYGKN